jgi:hypothetical protein
MESTKNIKNKELKERDKTKRKHALVLSIKPSMLIHPFPNTRYFFEAKIYEMNKDGGRENKNAKMKERRE